MNEIIKSLIERHFQSFQHASSCINEIRFSSPSKVALHRRATSKGGRPYFSFCVCRDLIRYVRISQGRPLTAFSTIDLKGVGDSLEVQADSLEVQAYFELKYGFSLPLSICERYLVEGKLDDGYLSSFARASIVKELASLKHSFTYTEIHEKFEFYFGISPSLTSIKRYAEGEVFDYVALCFLEDIRLLRLNKLPDISYEDLSRLVKGLDF
jgi:hypothetical protein